MPKKIVKKIKKIRTKREKEVKTRVGAPSLEERELDANQKQFSLLLAQGIDKYEAGKHVGFSRHKCETYSELPKVKEYIEECKRIFGLDKIEMMIALYNTQDKKAAIELTRRIETGEISERELIKINSRGRVKAGLQSDIDSEETTLSQTKKIAAPAKRKVVSSIPQIEDKGSDEIIDAEEVDDGESIFDEDQYGDPDVDNEAGYEETKTVKKKVKKK